MNYLLVDYENLENKKAAYKFPNIAHEILSTPNKSVLDYFSKCSVDQSLPNFERLFDHFIDKDKNVRTTEINFTRAGYIQKVITSLISSRSNVFIPYLLKKKILIKSLIRHSYSKSIALVLLNILITNSNNTASQSNTSEASENPDAIPIENLLKQTLAERLMFFGEIIKECISSIGHEENMEIHSNFAFIIMSVISKEFSERRHFMKIFLEHLDEMVFSICSSYSYQANNKLGNIFLIFLEIFFKDSEREACEIEVNLKQLQIYVREFYNLLIEKPNSIDDLNFKPKRRISSFPVELPKANLKIYKIIEAILMIIKFYIGNENFDQSIFLESKFDKFIFDLLINYPFNSILHNQIRKYLSIIIEAKDKAIKDIYFTNNQEFFNFLKYVTENRCTLLKSKKKINFGFTGQLVILTTLIIKDSYLKEKLIASILNRHAVERVH
jgi:hypothetical protein